MKAIFICYILYPLFFIEKGAFYCPEHKASKWTFSCIFFLTVSQKVCFLNDLEHFGIKAYESFSVKKADCLTRRSFSEGGEFLRFS
jgi:hypothetical protein